MRIKRILTCLIFALLSFTGLFFGCKNKYDSFSIEINGDTNITLTLNTNDREDMEREITVKVLNAPNEISKNITYSVNKPNIVSVEKISTNNENIQRFKVSALENITTYDPSCVITFMAPGNKTCELNVNVEIPITGLNVNKEYTPYVVANGENFYINTSNLIVFEPFNATQRNIAYSLVDESLVEKYGVNLSEDGKISVENYLYNDGVNFTALNEIEVLVKSLDDPLKEATFKIKVYRALSLSDIVVSYDFNLPEGSGVYANNFNGEKIVGEEGYNTSLSYLGENGITLASNIESKKNLDLGIFVKTETGLDFSKLNIWFEKTVLNNSVVEANNDGNINKQLSKFKMYTINSGLDILTLNIGYKEIADYNFSFALPINVLEYPISLTINDSDINNYNIFDYYTNGKGQSFITKIEKSGAYDKTFRVNILEEDFNNIEVRFKNELLDYETLGGLIFNSESELYIKSKSLYESKDINITFISNIVPAGYEFGSDEILDGIYTPLIKTLTLNLTPGVRSLDYSGVYANVNNLYLEKDDAVLEVPYLINDTDITTLNSYVNLVVLGDNSLIEISKDVELNKFIIKSNGKNGSLKFKLVSENGVELPEKTLTIYNYDENYENNLTLDLSSNYIKKVETEIEGGEGEKETKYYLGLSAGQNIANIKINNINNATIYNLEVSSEDESVIGCGVTSVKDLTFYITALKKTTEPIKITATITMFNSNDVVNNIPTRYITHKLEFEICTYNPVLNAYFNCEELVLVDGDNLDSDSLNKELNVLDISKYLVIEKQDNSTNNLQIDYILPKLLTNTERNDKNEIINLGDYEILKEEGNTFAKISFNVGRNHVFDSNNEFIFSLTVRIQDLVGSGEYYLASVKVVLRKAVLPDGIEILNEDGYLYLDNSSNFGVINAKVYNQNGKCVTNSTLSYKVLSGNSVSVDNNGLVTVKSSGITEILVGANATYKPAEDGFDISKKIYVIVADGSESYPYILKNESVILENCNYTLNSNIVLNNSITTKIASLNGKFVYSEYTNRTNKDAIFNIVYNKSESIFGEKLETKLKNLNIIINNSNAITLDSDFGFIAKENNAEINNVSLTIANTELNINENGINIGLMFANNSGTINNCYVNANVAVKNNNKTKLLFGGLVGLNEGNILGLYDYTKKQTGINYSFEGNINVDFADAIIGAIAGETTNGEVSGLTVKANIYTNSNIVGGVVGNFNKESGEYKNLLFNGKINSTHENSYVGGIGGKVNKSSTFELIYTEFINATKTSFGSNIKGKTVGGLFGRAENIGINYAYVNSLVSFDNYYDISGEVVGGLIGNAVIAELTAVYSNVSLPNNAGAFIHTAGSVEITDAYSYSTSNALINNGNATVARVYSTKSNSINNTTLTGTDVYLSNNYINVISNESFKTGNWRYNATVNNGLPYLVYNANTDLLTVVPESITASFVTNNKIETSNYYFGANENIVVINEDGLSNKAIIYANSNLSYNINSLLRIDVKPNNADIQYLTILSSNSNIVEVVNNNLIIKGVGDVTLTISHPNGIKTSVYISVVERITNFTISGVEEDYKIDIPLNKTKRVLTSVVGGNNTNYGVRFNYNNIGNNILFNNNVITNNESLSFASSHIFMGLNIVSTNYTVYPAYIIKFNGEEYYVSEYALSKIGNINVTESASGIYTDTTYFELTEKESLSFDVFVNTTNINEELLYNLITEEVGDLDNLEIIIKKQSDNKTFTIKISSKLSINIDKDIAYTLKLYPSSNSELYVEVDIILKSSKLTSVELNHYSSSTRYIDEFSQAITPSAYPKNEIVPGNLGVLNINLFPSYADIESVEVISSVADGKRINFGQLVYVKDSNDMVVISNAGKVHNGIKLSLNKSVKDEENFEYNGNLYVSTLLPSNVLEDTIFTITVIAYYNNGTESITTFIELKAKALTSIALKNPNGSNNFYIARGGKLELDINKINFSEAVTNFGFEFNETYDSKITSNLDNENNKLNINSNILLKSGNIFTIQPWFEMPVNGVIQRFEDENTKITVKVVDFVVNEVLIEECEDGILNNNLGNLTTLKAKLNVSKYLNADYNANEIEILEEIDASIKTLEDTISKAEASWILVTNTIGGNTIYTNLVEGGNYPNVIVKMAEGYYQLKGKSVSTTNLLLKANILYDENGTLSYSESAENEFRTPFIFHIKTYEEFLKMEEGIDYILLNDITIPKTFTGITTNIKSFDGNNKIINLEGFSLTNTNTTSLGLFNVIGENTIIKNVTVNILPILFQTDSYNYGLNINAQGITEFNFGVISGINNGIITNCRVINNNEKIINKVNTYKNITVEVTSSDEQILQVGLIAGVNNGYISNTKVGDLNSDNTFTLKANANLGGFVGINNKNISSSFIVNTKIINNSKNLMTGGFVASNSAGAQIITSYIEGSCDRKTGEALRQNSITDGGIFATGYVGGFVNVNDGKIKDCYSNIKVTTNKRSAGFVYNNTNGSVETSISASINGGENSQAFRYFTGNDEENNVLNNKGVKYSYYKHDYDINGSNDEFMEPANGIMSLDNAISFEGFIADDSSSAIWQFSKNAMPSLIDANIQFVSERKLVEDLVDAESYTYIYSNNDIGTKYNPIIVTNSNEFLNALTNERFLYSYNYSGKVIKTKINYNYINIVKDIDLSTIIDSNNNNINASSEVQKLQDIIFAGNLNGNGNVINNVTITAKNSLTNYNSFGLLKQIGVESTYDVNGKIVNNKLDKDNCSVIKNINFNINAISATVTRSVGTLSGEVINSKLYNISVSSENGVIVTGRNLVGGVAGRISGNSFVQGVTSSLSVQATYENKAGDYSYNYYDVKNIYKYAYEEITDTLNNGVNFVGGLFGVVDIYKTEVKSLVQKSNDKSYYLEAKINRLNNNDESKSQVRFVEVSGDIKLQGDVVGGLFGYVSEGTTVFDARLVLSESETQNIISNYSAGGLIGYNKGFISFGKVEHENVKQIEIDKNKDYIKGNLFANINNKAVYVGGLIGVNQNGILTNSYSKANIIAPNTQYVGSAIGLFNNGRINEVYAVSYLQPQEEKISDEGIITKRKGYAGFIGNLISYENCSISKIVSVVKPSSDEKTYNIATFVGYNVVKDLSIISGECNSEISTNAFGYNLSSNLSNSYDYYINKESTTFSSFSRGDTSCWEFPTKTDEETYPKLVYNKAGSIKGLTSEDDLYNILSNGNYILQNDIYLTKPWQPIANFRGTFIGNERPAEEHAEHGLYYKIYNLNITSASAGSGNVGFFKNTTGASISNVAFVVGTTLDDPKTEDINEAEDENCWGGYENITLGLNINSNITDENSIGALVGFAQNTSFSNITIDFRYGSTITTNFKNVGGLAGKDLNGSYKNINITNCIIQKTNSNMNSNLGSHNHYIGSLVGYAKNINVLQNINIKNSIFNISDDKHNSIIYIGGIAGELSLAGTNEKKDFIVDGLTVSAGGATIYGGAFVGRLLGENKNLTNVKIKNTEANYTLNANKTNNAYIGGLIGEANKVNLQNVELNNSNKIKIDSTLISSNNYVGGLIGLSANGKLENVYCAIDLNLKTKELNVAYIGGLIGQNGAANKVNGVEISNTICLTNIVYKDQLTSVTDNKIYVGGIVAYNYKANIANSYFIGKINPHTASLTNVGGFVGKNTNKEMENIDNSSCFFMTDLAQVAVRENEYATQLTYANFVNDILTDDCNFYETLINLITRDIFVDNIVKDSALAGDNVKTITLNGSTIYAISGSVYNPIEFDKDTSIDGNKYYILNNDIELNTTIDEFKGNLLGCGNLIILKNISFSKNITYNSLISGVRFEIIGDTKINDKDYANVNTIIAVSNKGVLFNIAVKGNIYSAPSGGMAPIVVENQTESYISIVTSYVNMLVLGNKQNDSLVSGFVAKNNSTISNCISVTNIEVSEHKIVDLKQIIKYSAHAVNKYFTNLTGFISDLSGGILVNNIVATTLPETNINNNIFNISIRYTTESLNAFAFYNNRVDSYSNGNFQVLDANAASYNINYLPSYNLVTEKLNENSLFANMPFIWKNINKDENEVDLGILYGYGYPELNYDYSKFLSSITTINGINYYNVNNVGVLKNVINKFNKIEDGSTININQVRSFSGVIKEKYMVELSKQEKIKTIIRFKPINLVQNLNYNGNGYGINSLDLDPSNQNGEKRFIGMFYSDSNTGVEINIKDLAITNYEVEIITADANMYVGLLVAKNIGKTTITGCYVDGKITSKQPKGESDEDELNAITFTDDKMFICGTLVGELSNNESEISSSVSNVMVLLEELSANTDKNDATKFYGYKVIAGGIVGKTTGATIDNNYSLKDIVISTAISLNAGGIVGEATNSEIKNNFTLSKVVYSGGYLSYYADEFENLTYNINAIIGKSGSENTFEGNQYNENLNFVRDINIDPSSSGILKLSEINFEISENKFTKTDSSILVGIPTIKIINEDSINDDELKNYITFNSDDATYEIKLENNTFYNINLTENSKVKFNLENIKIEKTETIEGKETTTISYELNNSIILFTNKVVCEVDETIFNKISNSTISNITFVNEDNTSLTNAVLADVIENTKLYNITLKDIYINHKLYKTDIGGYAGMLVNYAEKSSIINNIKIEKGRLNVSHDESKDFEIISYSGALVGYINNSIVQNSINSATITSHSTYSNHQIYVAGMVGYAKNSSFFNCENNGFVYAKGINLVWASGIVNSSYYSQVSFCINNGKIKASYIGNLSAGTPVITSGISSRAIIMFSINKGTLMSYTNVTDADRTCGLGYNSKVFYSYNHGTIASHSQAYALSNSSDVYYSYSVGTGYTTGSAEMFLCNGVKANSLNETKHVYGLNTLKEGLYKGVFADIPDMVIDNIISREGDELDNAHDYTCKAENPDEVSLVRIKLIDPSKFELKTNETDDTYLIYTPFDLWYWGQYKINSDKNVKLMNDIDMSGVTWQTSNRIFNKTFDGNYHIITNLSIKHGKESNRSCDSKTKDTFYASFIANNKGTIQNIYFKNPKLIWDTLYGDSEFSKYNYISIVAGRNEGEIKNILVASTNSEIFITITDDNKGKMLVRGASEDVSVGSNKISVGTIAGYNKGTIDACYVINLNDLAIESYISEPESIVTVNKRRIEVDLGGIVGFTENKNGVTNNYFYSSVNSFLLNERIDNGILNSALTNNGRGFFSQLLYSHASKTYNFVGSIAGFCLCNDTGNHLIDSSDEFITSSPIVLESYMKNYKVDESNYAFKYSSNDALNKEYIDTNGLDPSENIFTGNSTANMHDSKHSSYLYQLQGIKPSDVTELAHKFGNNGKVVAQIVAQRTIAKFGKKMASIAAKTTARVVARKAATIAAKAVPVLRWIVIGLEVVCEGIRYSGNISSFYQGITSGEGTINKDIISTDKNVTGFWNIFNKEESVTSPLGELIRKEFAQEDGIEWPIPTDFFKLSITRNNSIPKISNDKYYVYNANELAYALTQNNENSIVFMDTIDMTEKLWDNGLIIAGEHNIISNGFKVVLGNLNNENEILKEKLTSDNYFDSINDKNFKNYDYGSLDIIVNSVGLGAKMAFEERFKNAYVLGKFKKDYSDSDFKNLTQAKKEEKKEEYSEEYDTIKSKFAKDVYPVYFVEQLATISDALNAYEYNGKVHHALDFKNMEFEIMNDLNLSDFEGLQSLDNLVYSQNENDKFNTPNFVMEDSTFEYYIRYEFNGIIHGNEKTITVNSNFINSLGSYGKISNLTIKPTKQNISTNINNFGYIASENYGKIEKVTLDLYEIKDKIKIDYSLELTDTNVFNINSDFEYDENNNIVYTGKHDMSVNINTGLYCGLNSGKITNCNITNLNNNITITPKFILNYEDIYAYEIKGKDGEEDITYSGKFLVDGIKDTINLEINQNFGLVAGENNSLIDGLTINSANITLNSLEFEFGSLNADTDTNGFTITPTLKVNAGLLSGYNGNYNKTTDAKIKNVLISNSTLKYDYKKISAQKGTNGDGTSGVADNCEIKELSTPTTAYLGGIVGYTELSMNTCYSFNNALHVCVDDVNKTSEYKTGAIAGKASTLVYEKESADKDKMEEIQIIPTFTNIICGSSAFGEIAGYIEKSETQKVPVVNEDGKFLKTDGSVYEGSISDDNGNLKDDVKVEYKEIKWLEAANGAGIENIKEEYKFNVNVIRTLNGVTDDGNLGLTWSETINNNNFTIKVYKGDILMFETTGGEKGNKLFTTNPEINLTSLGFTIKGVFKGLGESGEDLEFTSSGHNLDGIVIVGQSNMSGDDYFVTINDNKIMVETTLSGKLGAQKVNNEYSYNFTVNYVSTSLNFTDSFAVESGKTVSETIESYLGEGFSLQTGDSTETISNKEYTLKYESNGTTINNIKWNVTVQEPAVA